MASEENIWQRLTGNQQAGFGIGTVLIIGLAFFLWWWAYSTNYGVLYKNLNEADAAKIASQLRDLKIDYGIGEAGSALLVDQDKIQETRLLLAEDGMPLTGQAGYELFDDVDYGMSDFSQKLFYQRALEGEIGRTIIALSSISAARIHLVLEEGSLFKADRQPPKASVAVVKSEGATLSKKDVQVIQTLVSSAVRGLDPAMVYISDETGASLTQSSDTASLSGRLERKKELEDYLSSKARHILGQLFSGESAQVSIDVRLSYTQIERHTEKLLPEGNSGKGLIVEMKETMKENPRSGAGAQKKGASKHGGMTKTSEVKYAVGKMIEKYSQRDGDIERIAVSVLVPSYASAEELEGAKELVATSVGLDLARGDLITVRSLSSTTVLDDELDNNVVQENSDSIGLLERSRKAKRVPTDNNIHVPGLNVELPLVYVGYLVLALLLLCLILIVSRVISSDNGVEELSEAEREKLLQSVRSWLNEETSQQELAE